MMARLFGLRAPAQTISARTAYDMQQSNGLIIIDVRTSAEWAETGTPRKARRLTLNSPGFLDTLPNDATPMALTCLHGPRAQTAAKQLAKAGSTQLFVIKGGITAWTQAGLPLDRAH
jgi:rhodanese-related sulfurtransferase